MSSGHFFKARGSFSALMGGSQLCSRGIQDLGLMSSHWEWMRGAAGLVDLKQTRGWLVWWGSFKQTKYLWLFCKGRSSFTDENGIKTERQGWQNFGNNIGNSSVFQMTTGDTDSRNCLWTVEIMKTMAWSMHFKDNLWPDQIQKVKKVRRVKNTLKWWKCDDKDGITFSWG